MDSLFFWGVLATLYKESVKHMIKEDGTFAETKSAIANEIAASLSKKSSSDNYSETFRQNKRKEEKKKPNYNSPQTT